MVKEDSIADRAFTALVSGISGRSAVVLALALYGAGLALPLTLHWRTAFLVETNAVGTLFAAMVVIGWLLVRLQKAQRRNLLEWTSDLRLLTAQEFEWLVGEVFRRDGWRVKETGRQDAADGNIDLELMRDGQRKIVQCKRWQSWPVGVSDIREFAGTLLREHLPGNAGMFVTLSDFTADARADAKMTGIELLDKQDLYTRIEQVRRTEPCPICTKPMIVDMSSRGWWLRCVGERCSGKRDLASEPGRAIALLTQPS